MVSGAFGTSHCAAALRDSKVFGPAKKHSARHLEALYADEGAKASKEKPISKAKEIIVTAERKKRVQGAGRKRTPDTIKNEAIIKRNPGSSLRSICQDG